MKIYVDADSCPRACRELIVKRAGKEGLTAVFAANRPIPGISGEYIVMEICASGEGAADDRIVELAGPEDLVITRDIPLASRLVDKGVAVLDDRGGSYTAENIRERLSMRNFMVDLAESGLGMKRSAVYGKKELKSFADAFDRVLAQLLKP
ncbi:MAG: DUF188 domain-containing protein [Treponema sp.]|nr:DUF188 domain-containing protein [Treponema sp.]